MARIMKLSLKGSDVHGIFLTTFGAVSVVPPLAFLYLANRYNILSNLDTGILLALTALLSVSGMFLMRQTLKRIADLRDALVSRRKGDDSAVARITSRELQKLGARETQEIADIVLEFNNLLQELKENTRKLERIVFQSTTLSDLTELTSSISDMDQLLEVVLKKTMKGVEADTGSIMILNEKGTRLRIAASQGLPPDVAGKPMELSDTVAGRVLLNNEPVMVANVACNETFGEISNSGLGSFMSLPLKVRKKPLGVLNVAKYGKSSGEQAFNTNDLNFLTTLLNHIGFALENARLLAEAKQNAQRLERVLQEKSTELDRTKQQMVDVERLRIVGELASGVAHELNNPLTVVLGYSQMLLRESGLHESVHDKLSKIRDQAIRAKKVTQNLLLFARHHEMERDRVDIHELLDRALEVVGYEMKTADVTVRKRYERPLPKITLDPHQITQVFINLIFNAYQAMQEDEGSGELLVETRRRGGNVSVAIEDTGPGIPAENLGKIFDPFFTTKDIGKGTGLGLSISFGVVQEHDGAIRAESGKDGGARFVVELPCERRETAVDADREATESVCDEAEVSEILVVDDEAEVREMMSECLRAKGFRVESVASCKQAVASLKDHPYDLVVCDFKMPGMDGKDLHRMIHSRPKLKRYRGRLVFITGDTFNKSTQEFIESENLPCLSKPFMIEEFLAKVKSASSTLKGLGC